MTCPLKSMTCPDLLNEAQTGTAYIDSRITDSGITRRLEDLEQVLPAGEPSHSEALDSDD